MKDKKPRVLYENEDTEQELGKLSAEYGVSKKRLRGMAIENFVESSEADEYIERTQDNE